MTEQQWGSFAGLYREIWKAHADLATLRTMLTMAEFAAHQNKPDIAAKAIAGWQERLERSRGKNFYAKYLSKCEQHIPQAEGQRSDTVLLRLFADDPQCIGGNGTVTLRSQFKPLNTRVVPSGGGGGCGSGLTEKIQILEWTKSWQSLDRGNRSQ